MFFLSLTVIAAMSLLPGYLAIYNLPAAMRSRLIDRDTLLPAAFAVSVMFIVVLQFAVFLTGGPMRVLNLACYGLVVSILFARLRIIAPQTRFEMPGLVGPFALLLLWMLGMLMHMPSYSNGFAIDWQSYYPNTSVYLGETPAGQFNEGWPLEYLAKRTPALSLFGSFFASLMGRAYSQFQLTSLFLNALVMFPVYLWTRAAFGRRAATMALILTALAPAMIRQTSVPEPKFVATFFALMGLWYYLSRPGSDTDRPWRRGFAGVLFVFAYFCHPSMLLFVGWVYLWEIGQWIVSQWRRRGPALETAVVAPSPGEGWRDAVMPAMWLSSTAAVLLLLAPWWAWLASELGANAAFRPTITISKPIDMTVWQYVYTRLGMMAATLGVPAGLLYNVWRDHWANAAPTAPGAVDIPRILLGNAIVRMYDQSYLAGLTFAVGITTALRGWRIRPIAGHSGGAFKSVLIWMALGSLTGFALHLGMVDYKGHATNVTAPLFLVFVMIAGAVLATLRPATLVAVLALACIESAGMRIVNLVTATKLGRLPEEKSFAYVFDRWGGWITSDGAVPYILFMIIIAAAFVWSVLKLEQQGEVHPCAS